MTVNNDAEPYGFCNWNEYNLNPLTRNDWRASLVPAAAVIPAPIAYIKVVAVKKLVVGPKTICHRSTVRLYWCAESHLWGFGRSLRGSSREPRFTVKKLECSKQAYA